MMNTPLKRTSARSNLLVVDFQCSARGAKRPAGRGRYRALPRDAGSAGRLNRDVWSRTVLVGFSPSQAERISTRFFHGFDLIIAESLDAMRAYLDHERSDIVVAAPLIWTSGDAMDVAILLQTVADAHPDRMIGLRVFANGLPRPLMVEQELRRKAPSLDLQLIDLDRVQAPNLVG